MPLDRKAVQRIVRVGSDLAHGRANEIAAQGEDSGSEAETTLLSGRGRTRPRTAEWSDP